MALLKVNKKWTCYHLINAQLSPCTLHLLLGVPRSRRYLQMGHQVAQGTWPPYRTAQIRPRVFRRWRHWNVNFYACADLGRFRVRRMTFMSGDLAFIRWLCDATRQNWKCRQLLVTVELILRFGSGNMVKA